MHYAKKILIAAALCAVLACACRAAGQRITYVHPKNYGLVKDLGDPKLSDENSMSIILLGDTQAYTTKRANACILRLMMSWIVSQKDILDIRAVLGVGDIVQISNKIKFRSEDIEEIKKGYIDGENFYRQGNPYCDYSSSGMWRAASDAYAILDNNLPYFITTGNHDHGDKMGDARCTRFNEFFNADRNRKNYEALREVGFDESGKDALQNAVYKLSLGGKWGDLHVLALEFKPRAEILAWADNLLKSPKYKGKRFIMITHAFLKMNGKLSSERGYKVEGKSGDEVWGEFVSKHPEIKAVFCGHHCLPVNDFEFSTSFAEMQNDAGGKVSVMMFNPQTLGGGFNGNGGDGWLRILELMPDGETVKVKTFSPLFGISPMTKHFAWRVAPFDMFEFKISK